MKNLLSRITIEPDKLGGKPCIRGFRVSVETILNHLADGDTIDEILSAFPFLEVEDIRAALAYGAFVASNKPSHIKFELEEIG